MSNKYVKQYDDYIGQPGYGRSPYPYRLLPGYGPGYGPNFVYRPWFYGPRGYGPRNPRPGYGPRGPRPGYGPGLNPYCPYR